MLNWILGTIAIGLWATAYGWYHWRDIRGFWTRLRTRRVSAKGPEV